MRINKPVIVNNDEIKKFVYVLYTYMNTEQYV